jgi:hypothetical protein
MIAGCGPKSVDYAVNVVTRACDMSAPFDGAQFVQVRVTGTGIETPLMTSTAVADGTLQLPDIPVGPKRVIEIRAYADDPSVADAKPMALGRSTPFDVPETIDPAKTTVMVNVFLRKVGAFTPPSSVQFPTTCSQMRAARAGHTATLMQDGRVLITGGYALDGDRKSALRSAEVYDPVSGTFESAADMPVAKAFHVGALLQNGQVFLQGGELYPDGGTPSPTTSAFFFDPSTMGYSGQISKHHDGTPILARTQHTAVVDSKGKVLIAGGLGANLAPVAQVEWYDYALDTMSVAVGQDLQYPIGVAGAALNSGATLAVIGGTNAGGLSINQAILFEWKDQASSFVQSNTVTLAHPRSTAAAAARPDGSVAIVAGLDQTSTELLDGNTATPGPDVGARSALCAVSLPDGTVLAIGGKKGTPPKSDESATLISFAGAGAVTAAPALKKPRWAHTCTLLADGTVLVTGGVDDSSGSPAVLQDAYIYTPVPAD